MKIPRHDKRRDWVMRWILRIFRKKKRVRALLLLATNTARRRLPQVSPGAALKASERAYFRALLCGHTQQIEHILCDRPEADDVDRLLPRHPERRRDLREA